jgi:hypothetical protein
MRLAIESLACLRGRARSRPSHAAALGESLLESRSVAAAVMPLPVAASPAVVWQPPPSAPPVSAAPLPQAATAADVPADLCPASPSGPMQMGFPLPQGYAMPPDGLTIPSQTDALRNRAMTNAVAPRVNAHAPIAANQSPLPSGPEALAITYHPQEISITRSTRPRDKRRRRRRWS